MTYPAAGNSTWLDLTLHCGRGSIFTADFNIAWSARRVGRTLVAWQSAQPEWSSQRGPAPDSACRKFLQKTENGCDQRFWRWKTAAATTSSWFWAPQLSTYPPRRVPCWQPTGPRG